MILAPLFSFSNPIHHAYISLYNKKLSSYACCTDIGTRAVASRGSTLLGLAFAAEWSDDLPR